MRLFVSLCLLITCCVVTSWETPSTKCCANDNYLNYSVDNYKCEKSVNTRLQILWETDNFLLNENSTGECVDVSDDDFFRFGVLDGKVIKRNNLSVNYFPKCCPLNWVYDEINYSCVEISKNLTRDFITSQFVKVGLPQCKIISDKKFNGGISIIKSLLVERNQGSFCIDKNTKDELVIRECTDNLDICKKTRCIRKCCPDGQSFVGGGKCTDTFTYGMDLNFSYAIKSPEEGGILVYNTKCDKVTFLGNGNKTATVQKFYFNLEKSGVFRKTFIDSCAPPADETVENPQSYCIEHAYKPSQADGFYFFYCIPEQPPVEGKFVFTRWSKIVSCIFLILTIIIYFLVNEVKSLFGKILINYCLATLLEMIVLAYSQAHLEPTKMECKVRSYLIIFFANALFTWLNIMCLDIYWTFCSTKKCSNDEKWKDLRKFLYYLLYGWGFPTILTGLVLFFDLHRVLPRCLQPNLGITKCFFENEKGNYGATIFFYIPHLLLQVLDAVLFIRTIVYCLQIKKAINKINDTKSERRKKFETDTKQLVLICKLSVIMGVLLIFEVISAFFEMSKINKFTEYLEIVMDNITCLQGLLIFIIFICKRKIIKDLRRKLISIPSGPSVSSTSTTSTVTLTSNEVNMDLRALPKKEVIKTSEPTEAVESKIK